MEVREPSARYLQSGSVGPAPIPDTWNTRALAELAQIQSGIAKNANGLVSDPVELPYLRVANVQDGYVDLTDVATIRVSREDVRRYAVRAGDVLMNEGGDLDKLGRGTLWRGQIDPCVHQNHVFVVRCREGLLPEYLSVWTGSATARRYFLLAGRQTTNLASINKTSLGELPVAMPGTAAEQAAIAAAVRDADALIESMEQLLAKKRQLKQGAMQELLTGKKRLPGFIQGWEVARLGDLASMRSGGTPPTSVGEYYGGRIPWVSIADMTNTGKWISLTQRTLSEKGLGACAAVTYPAGTVLYAMYASIGECTIAAVPMTSSQAILGIQPRATLNAEFLYYVLTERRDRVRLLGQQGTQANLNAGMVRAFELALPSVPEQAAIAAVLSALDIELEALEARLAKARALKQGMAQALLTGRIRLAPFGEQAPAASPG
ncbi:MAG: restriction endonuclease subunit S [Rhodoferax sp.]|nr:restriction endonuclease subunit S [Rhodoferax sp.]